MTEEQLSELHQAIHGVAAVWVEVGMVEHRGVPVGTGDAESEQVTDAADVSAGGVHLVQSCSSIFPGT